MFIDELTIKNVRCFSSNSMPLKFNVPDGHTSGSGLNIFVGENGTGKTTVLDALSYLTESPYALQNKLSVFDFGPNATEITVTATMDRKFDYKMPDTYRGCYFVCNGIAINIKLRKQKSRGRLLSPALATSRNVISTDDSYRNKEGEQKNKIEEYHKIFDEGRLSTEEINVFYFDKNRARQISKGLFRTTFERIADDLNWKFRKSLSDDPDKDEELLGGLANQYFTSVLDIAQKGVGSKIAKQTKKFFSEDVYNNIKVDLFNLLWPFSNSFFALRDQGLAQIPVAKLGSGVEMIFTLFLLKSLSGQSKDSTIYLIDEPELSLYPQAQRKLLALLLEESKSKQVFISTHSSYFTDPNSISNIFRFQKDNSTGIKVLPEIGGTASFDLKENRNFFFRHRDLFFTNTAIFVEGIEDYNRYSSFCENNDLGDIPGHLYMMNGCGPTFFFEKFCGRFGIKFFAIVDIDFLEKIPDALKELEAANAFNQNDKDSNRKQWYRDNLGKIRNIYEKYRSDLKSRGIFVMPSSDVKDIISDCGKVVGDYDLKNTLICMFSSMRDSVLGGSSY